MEDESSKLKSYLDRIDRLQEAQKAISDEMLEIKKEIRAEWYQKTIAKKSERESLIEEYIPLSEPEAAIDSQAPLDVIETVPSNENIEYEVESKEDSFFDKISEKFEANSSGFNWEKFVGENLINKLGVLIILIGVVIGAKYSIENDLINPTTRIALGYLTGLSMLVVGIWSKAKYVNYSAVLVSGAMAIMFFITFFAYSFYQLISLEVAFGLMVLFTAFTVVAAIKYNRQVIAIIGLVGAYAVPFLLSNDTGAYEILFGYITLVNVGILFIAFKKDWKLLCYTTFAFTWLIYLTWFVQNADDAAYFRLAFTFLFIFFVLFYALILAYKFYKNDSLTRGDIIFVFLNASIFFLSGYLLLDTNAYQDYLGLFTLGNGVIHFGVASLVYQKALGNKEMFYLLAALVLVFITITIPIQLEGNVVPMLWVVEAAFLFWIGRSKQVKLIEYFSYSLMTLASLSVLQSWTQGYYSNMYGYGRSNYEDVSTLSPLFNTYFLTSIIAVIGFGWMWKVNKDHDIKDEILSTPISKLLNVILSLTAGFMAYMAFHNEIAMFSDIKHEAIMDLVRTSDSSSELYDYLADMKSFKLVWISIYTMLFLTGVSWLTMNKVMNRLVGRINIGLNAIVLFSFLTTGLLSISQLRSSYLDPNGLLEGQLSIAIRYISILSASALMYITYQYQQKSFIGIKLYKWFSIFFHLFLLWIVTSEFFHWADMLGMDKNYKLSLSILWGIYSVLLVSYGIWKNRKHLRIMAISLFAITLVKLFVYDIAHLNTISKTIVFVSLGVLLLIISFLYNKYTSRINDED